MNRGEKLDRPRRIWLQAVAGVAVAAPLGRGGCTAIPGDTEISPNGWCVMWEAKK